MKMRGPKKKKAKNKNNLNKVLDNIELSQNKLSKILGVAQSHICRVANGKSEPSLNLARRISKFLNKSIEDIFPE